MSERSKCFGCHEPVSNVALVDLVYTWEPFKADTEIDHVEEVLKEVAWHKECYLHAQAEMQAEGDGK
jgi:hypothetical protein